MSGLSAVSSLPLVRGGATLPFSPVLALWAQQPGLMGTMWERGGMGHGVTWTPAQGSVIPWLTRHAAVFLPGTCSPQLPVPCQFIDSLWGTRIYKENRAVRLIMVSSALGTPVLARVVSRGGLQCASSSPIRIAAPVTLVSYSDRRALLFPSLEGAGFLLLLRNTLVILCFCRIGILPRHSYRLNKEDRKTF